MSSGHHRLGHELQISILPCLSRPTGFLAFAFKHGPSLHFKRTLAHFLKRAFVLAFEFAFALALEFAFTPKLIPFSCKSDLGLKLILAFLKLILVLKLLFILRLKLVLKRALPRTTPTR
ncbi:hypothetical protein K523DRAFT_358609 [Schizophyllum commune Tattone D]|nr:hypothetical protein K523DRAFT_358609 [Schizophyllum commune Tattone D]